MANCPNLIFKKCVRACVCECVKQYLFPVTQAIFQCVRILNSQFLSNRPYGNSLCLSHPLFLLVFLSFLVICFVSVSALQKYTFVCSHECLLSHTVCCIDIYFFYSVCSFQVGHIFSRSPWEPIMKTQSCCHVQTHFWP